MTLPRITRTMKLFGLALNAAWLAACGGASTPPPATGSCGAKGAPPAADADAGKGSCGQMNMPEKGACGGHGGTASRKDGSWRTGT